jgi:hypothetical protein
MKNLLLLSLLVTFITSCEKDDHDMSHYALWDEETEVNCHGEPLCLGYYEVSFRFNKEGAPDNLIIAHNGTRANLGELMKFEAVDVPGWKFITWRKMPNQYCEYSPLIDDEDPRIAYTFMHEKYMGNCNIGPQNIRLYAEYIQTLD